MANGPIVVIDRNSYEPAYAQLVRILLGTVEGDIHDLGKNIVNMLLSPLGKASLKFTCLLPFTLADPAKAGDAVPL